MPVQVGSKATIALHLSLLFVGALMVVYCLYLLTVKVSHTGTLVFFVIGVALVFHGVYGRRFQLWLQMKNWRMRLWKFGLVLFSVWIVTLLGFFALLHGRGEQGMASPDPEVILVLGSSTPNGKPSPALMERLQLAHQLALRYPRAVVVVSGGVDFRQVVSEAQVMGLYLEALGLPKERILLEDKSTSTQENLAFSAHVLKTIGYKQSTPTLLVTSDFHTPRAARIALKAGWPQLRTVGAPTPLYMRYPAWTREYFACINGWLRREF